MASSPPTPADLEWLIAQAKAWIIGLREEYRNHPRAFALGGTARPVLERYFPAVVLDAVRCVEIEEIPDPPFKAEGVNRGIPERAMAFSQADGLTCQDVILLLAHPKTFGPWVIVFHELVHVVQSMTLGWDEFLSQYVRGYRDAGWVYPEIPLEVMAYDLQARFEASPRGSFSVVDEVRRRLRH